MRAFFIVIAILIIIALGYLGYAQISGGAVPTFGLAIGGERAVVRKHIKLFFEDVRFKNKSALSALVSPGSSIEDIEAFLSQIFGAEPNQVDLLSTCIKSVEIDSAGQRARAIVNIKGKNLSTDKDIDVIRLMFLYKNDQSWLVDIKNPSL